MSTTKNINAEKIQGNLNISGVTATIISGGTLYGDGSNLTGLSSGGGTFTGGTVNGPTIFTNGVTADTITSTTYYGDGSNLTGISSTDNYVTGGTYSNGNLFFSGNSVQTTFSVDVSSLVDTNYYVTGGTVSGTDLVLGRNGGLGDVIIDTSSYFDNVDNYVTGATINVNTLELSRSGGLSNVTVDLSQFIDDTNYYVTGFTYNNSNTLTLTRNGGLPDLTTSINVMSGLTVNGTMLATLVSGTLGAIGTMSTTTLSTNNLTVNGVSTLNGDLRVTGNTLSNIFSGRTSQAIYYGDGSNLTGISSTDNYVTGGTYTNGVLLFSGTSSNQSFSIDVSDLIDDTNYYVTGSTLNGNTLELSRNGGLSTLTTDLSQFLDNTDNFITGGTMNGNILELSRSGGLNDVTVDLSQFVDDTNFYVTGFTYNNANEFTISRNGGLGDLTITADTMENLTTNTLISTNIKVNSVDTSIHNNPLFVSRDTNSITGDSVDISELSTYVTSPNNNNNSGTGIGFGISTVNSNVGSSIIHERTGTASKGKLHFATKTNTVSSSDIPIIMTISDDGNVGIGTQVPNNKLTVIGSVSATTYYGDGSNLTGISGSGEVNTASNLTTTGLFAQKNGTDLEFKGITSTGGTITITSDSNTVNIESNGGTTGVSDANKIFSWFMNIT